MPIHRLAIAVAVAAAFAVLPGVASADTTECSGSVSQGFWTKITATNTSCASAKSLIRRWIRTVDFGDVDPPPKVTVGAYTCKIKFKSSQGEAGKLTCTASGGRKVTSVGAP
jgi:hypothetical protein